MMEALLQVPKGSVHHNARQNLTDEEGRAPRCRSSCTGIINNRAKNLSHSVFWNRTRHALARIILRVQVGLPRAEQVLSIIKPCRFLHQPARWTFHRTTQKVLILPHSQARAHVHKALLALPFLLLQLLEIFLSPRLVQHLPGHYRRFSSIAQRHLQIISGCIDGQFLGGQAHAESCLPMLPGLSRLYRRESQASLGRVPAAARGLRHRLSLHTRRAQCVQGHSAVCNFFFY